MKSQILYKLVEDLVFHGSDAPYAQLKTAINRIDNDYFDDIQRDCETLPAELSPMLRDKIITDFKRKISLLLTDCLCDSIVERVQNNSIVPISDDDLAALDKKIRKLSDSMQKSIVDLSGSDEEIDILYRKAKERTLTERLMQSNKEDVIRFHHALQDNTSHHARQLVDLEMSHFLTKLAHRLHQ